ncbi:MAG: hypothetical protein WC438_01140 [Candidatus Pacearchaeota archaeon]
MECFIKKVWLGNGDGAHSQFVRFSKGVFAGRAALKLTKTTKIKLGGSFEWANDFAEIVAELDKNAEFSGIIMSREQLDLENEKGKTGVYNYEVENIDSSKINDIKNKAYALLLDSEGNGLSLKIKKKLPKPGKSAEAKIDDKFCVLEADLRYWDKIKHAFMLPECKKCIITHTFEIKEIVIPPGEKDFEKARLMSKRKGKILRKLEVDKISKTEEHDFEA